MTKTINFLVFYLHAMSTNQKKTIKKNSKEKVKKIGKEIKLKQKYHCELNKTIELTYSFDHQGKRRCGVGMPQMEYYKDFSMAIDHLMNHPKRDDIKFIKITQKLWYTKYNTSGGGTTQWGGYIILFRYNIDDDSENVNTDDLKEIVPGHPRRYE